jgi:hypothetical protein
MPDVTDYEIASAMILYGGTFAVQLGHLWSVADLENRARVTAAWPELWDQYRELALLKAAGPHVTKPE